MTAFPHAGALAPADSQRPKERRSPALVKSADRTMQVLEFMSDHPAGVSLTELQRELSIPKSSLHGLLQTLVGRGWLETDRRGTIYGIGLRALRIGATFLDRDPIVDAAGLVLTHVRSQIDETVHLARLDGADVVYLVSKESAHHLRTSSRIGRRLPAHSTALGQVLLAARTAEELDAILPEKLAAVTSETITDRPSLDEELARTRERGWAYERGQNTPGLCCMAVAVPDCHPAMDAVSCSIPLVRLTDEHRVQVIDALTHAADELGHATRRTN
jgi:DNA-binding IclR family transcriptional regulator